MSSICRGGFVENAWRKDLCSNCFRTREEHGEVMTSGFYQQPSWTHQSSTPTPSVAIQVKSSAPSNVTSASAAASNYGLPPTPTQSKILSAASRYQSPSVGSGLNTVGNNNIPVRSNGSAVGSRYGHGGGPAAIGSRINALYSDRLPQTARSNSGASATATSGGINVTVNGTSNSNIKKYVQQHPAPPQPAVRTSIPNTGGNRVHTNNLPGGGVSVSVGRSPSYSSLNTVGTTTTTPTVRSNGSTGPYTSMNNNSNNTGSNYGNSINNNGLLTSHHYHQQRRTAHSQPPTHHQQPSYTNGNTNNTKSSSVPVLTQSRTHLQQNSHTTPTQDVRVKTGQVTAIGSLQLNGDKDRSRAMDMADGETHRMGMRSSGFCSAADLSVPESKSSIPKTNSKGILRRDGQRRKMSVTFPTEVCAVIGYGGECNMSDEESDEEVPYDPLDNSSIPEILEKSATSPLEKELIRVTVKNTNFNSVKTNLMGFAPIEIGPIVGGTGGKSKPLVSIGTFDSRKEPLRVLRKVGGTDDSTQSTHSTQAIPSTLTKNGKGPISKMVNSLGKVKSHTPPSSSPPTSSANRETEKSKTNCVSSVSSVTDLRRNGLTQNHGMRNDNRISAQKGRGNETSSSGLLAQLKQHNSMSTVTEKQTLSKDNHTLERVHKEHNVFSESHAEVEGYAKVSEGYAKVNEGHANVNESRLEVSTRSVTSEALKTETVENETVTESAKALETKRSSFLREIINSIENSALNRSLPSPSGSAVSENSVNSNNSANNQVDGNNSVNNSVNNNNDRMAFVSLPHDSLEPPRIIKSELKLEQSLHYHSKEQTYEDDSLEADSGLDTNPSEQTRTSETSESDTEKSGSNSDSGNENDFVDKKLISRTGLFVSIDPDLDEGNAPMMSMKPAKLSPDSVISSEMSSTSPTDSSGSNESIPQKISDEEEAAAAVAVSPPAPKLNNAPIPPVLKRAAPLPPVLPFPMSQPIPAPHPYCTEDLYDDVHLSGSVPMQQQEEATEDAEESIYDDCATVKDGKITKGSYDFTDPGGIAPECGESVPLKQYPGIEFLGIRRIDSESFLKESSPPLSGPPSPSKTSPGKKDRSGSESPKPKRRVNQFFSTIGKKAGAAFRSTNTSQGTLDLSPNLKSSSMKSGPDNTFSPYKRSMSTDEVSMTRTQELYATLTPTTLKIRGLTPVLNKLSKFDLREPKDDSAEKKKSKFSTSIKKFLGFGAGKTAISGEDAEPESPTRNSPPRITESPPRLDSHPPAIYSTTTVTRPPPPPPRVHSLDTLSKSGTVNMKPARPPPPRVNQVAPSFVSVFAGLEDAGGLEDPPVHDFYSPPNKPRRKASICRENDGGSGAYTANYLETTYNHITSLNFETLKLIASQSPAKIKRASNQLLKMNKSPLRWSQFYVTDVETLAYGHGYAFFSAFWEDEPCVLLLQESLSCGLAPLEFDCIEMSASFEDVVQPQFVPWESSDFVNTGNGVRVYISVLAACTVQRLSDYVNNGAISPSRKFYALLQAMDFWGKEEMANLVVFHKIPSSQETVEEPFSPNKSKSSPSPNFGLVYVVSTRIKTGSNSLLACQPARDVFEGQIYEILFSSSTPILVDNDKDILQRRLEGSTTEEVEAQLRLFLQLKLFGPRSGDLDKILRYRSERQVTQWMDKERAFCMNDALKRSLERNSEPMSPLRKSFVEFLMISDNCAKTILDFIVDLYPD